MHPGHFPPQGTCLVCRCVCGCLCHSVILSLSLCLCFSVSVILSLSLSLSLSPSPPPSPPPCMSVLLMCSFCAHEDVPSLPSAVRIQAPCPSPAFNISRWFFAAGSWTCVQGPWRRCRCRRRGRRWSSPCRGSGSRHRTRHRRASALHVKSMCAARARYTVVTHTSPFVAEGPL